MISIIVAMGNGRIIGNKNELPWKMPADMKRFKTITTGNTVLMGRLTYESIGKPLPKRKNIILSRDPNLKIKGCSCITSIDKIVEKNKDVICIGGSQIYKLVLPFTSFIYLTSIDGKFKGDTYFPEIPPEFKPISSMFHAADDKNPYNYIFSVLQNKELIDSL